MTDEQKNFLNEFGALLDKYSIDKICAADGGMITFETNGDVLSFRDFDGDTFNAVVSAAEMYMPDIYLLKMYKTKDNVKNKS